MVKGQVLVGGQGEGQVTGFTRCSGAFRCQRGTGHGQKEQRAKILDFGSKSKI